MAKQLLPPVTRYFKANLHTHSTLSDGKLAPSALKAAYKAMGYQILSITDHNLIVDHSPMTEPDFLMLTGVEVNYNQPDYRGYDGKTYHLNLIAKQADNLWAPCKTPRRYPEGLTFAKEPHYEGMDTQYSPESINEMIAKANEMGFLVMYNHPTWSCQSYPDYAPLKGLWGMELRNNECCHLGNNENNARVFADLLHLGNRLYPLGTDDAHSPDTIGGAWIMVGAEQLRYNSVIKALEQGDFYMSCGPEIHSLALDGSILTLTCSDAQQICWESHGRLACRVTAEESNWLHETKFNLESFLNKADGDPNAYIRFTVTAPDGTYAATRAYFLDELQKA